MGFLQHYYVKVSADYSDPPPMHPHAAELPENFAPLTGRTGRRGFFATTDSWRALSRPFPTEQETAPYETVCERPTAHELPRVYT